MRSNRGLIGWIISGCKRIQAREQLALSIRNSKLRKYIGYIVEYDDEKETYTYYALCIGSVLEIFGVIIIIEKES